MAKPDSHPALYEWLAMLEQAGAMECLRQRRWNGTFAQLWTHRWAAELPLRTGGDALRVNWLELTITHKETGEALYHNTWVTNHAVSAATVGALAKVGEPAGRSKTKATTRSSAMAIPWNTTSDMGTCIYRTSCSRLTC